MRRLNEAALLGLILILGAYGKGNAQTSSFTIPDRTVTSTATLIDNTRGRYALSCTNHSSTVHVRWGPALVTSSAGQRVPASSTIEIRSRAAVYMISEGANVTVSCTGEEN